MPCAKAPKAPWVEVWLSPQTMVMPGCVRPCSGPTTWTMPFLMSPEVAAHKIARAIERRKSFYVFPWQMRWVGRALKGVPRPVYDRLLAHRPRKPRIAD